MSTPAELGILTTDASLVVTSWDGWLGSASGIPRDAALGRAIVDIIPDLEQRGLLRRLHAALQEGTVEVLAPALHRYLIACSPRTPSARFERMQQRVTIGPLLESDAIVGVLVTIEDVTARLDAERDLAEAATTQGDLASDDWRVRQAAVERLAATADADYVSALVASLRDGHRDFNLLSSALKLLGSTGVEVTTALAELLREGDADLRIQAALALGAQHDSAAIAPLRAALRDADVNVRFQAVESLGRLRAEAAIDDLLSIVESEDFFLAFAALDALVAIRDARISSRLVPLLGKDGLRVPIAEALSHLGDERAVPALVGTLNESPRGVISLASALSSIHARFERDYDDGTRIVDEVRARATPAGHEALVQAIPAAHGEELRALVRVLGWFESDAAHAALTRLLADATVRPDVIEALVRHGDRVVDRLIEQLDAADRDIRHAAIVALGRVGSRRATAALVSMLVADGDLLVAIAGALARIGDQAAFEPLLALLGHPDGAVRQSVIGALNSIGHPDLPRRIAELLRDRDPLVRESAVRIAGYFGYAETVDELFHRATDDDEAVRRAALEHLPFMDDARVLPSLVAALAGDTPRGRAAAARALGRVDGPAAAAALAGALGDPDAWVRYFAVRGLSDRRHDAPGDVLMRLADHDPAEHVRIAALDALGVLGIAGALPMLKRLAHAGPPDVAAAALSALGGTAADESLQVLQDALRSPSPPRRLAAVKALVVNGSVAAVESLQWAAAADVEPAVSGSAIEALGAVAGAERPGSSAAIDALIELLGDRATRDRVQQAVVGLLASRIRDLSRGLQHPQPEVRSATVDVLGRFQCEEATHAIGTALADSAPAVREMAVVTLARLGARGMESALAALSANDPSKAVRRAAAAALSGQRG